MRRTWTIGHCWRCDAPNVYVLWLGPVQSQDHGHAPFSCCRPCVLRLEALVDAYNRRVPGFR